MPALRPRVNTAAFTGSTQTNYACRRIFYISQASGFIISPTYGPEPKKWLPLTGAAFRGPDAASRS